jgi:cyclase
MLKKRIIPVLLIKDKDLIKTIKFKEYKYIGDPLNAIKIFNEKFVDELIILDVNQNKNNSHIDYHFLQDLFSECFVPVTYGGGISSLGEADKILKLGVEKICLNSAVLNNMEIIKDFARNFGSQSIVVSIDVKRNFFGKPEVYNNKMKKFEKKLDLESYFKVIEDLGAGEILINSIDKDGTMKGMDLNLIDQTQKIVNLPVIYSGGIGSVLDIKKAFTNDISGIAAGSLFLFYGPHKAVLISYPHKEFDEL